MMIRFDEGGQRFNYRIVGVAVHEQTVLLHQAEDEDFWTFPGGRAELGEPAEQTLRREMKEEIGAEVEVVRLLWFVENFFEYAEKRYHEIALYFLIRFPPACQDPPRSGSFQGAEGEMKLTFRWFPLDPVVLARLPLYPSFLQTALQQLPDSVRHIVHYGA
jgi:ADP-ribose pyrophosphatase YjhB (NUDIX family)